MEIERIFSKEEIYEILLKFDHFFTPTLSSRVGDLFAYAKKLCNFAELYAMEDQCTLGFVAIYCNDIKRQQGYVAQIATIPIARGKGVSTTLLQYCDKIALMRGMKTIKSEIYHNNTFSISLFEKNGYLYLSEAGANSSYYYKSLEEKG